MANVHFKKWLIHTAIIERPIYTQSGSGEEIPAWAVVDTIRCRLVQKNERVANSAIGEMVKHVDRLLFDIGEDVGLGDRVVNIILTADGSVVDDGPFLAEELLTRNRAAPFHDSVRLEKVS